MYFSSTSLSIESISIDICRSSFSWQMEAGASGEYAGPECLTFALPFSRRSTKALRRLCRKPAPRASIPRPSPRRAHGPQTVTLGVLFGSKKKPRQLPLLAGAKPETCGNLRPLEWPQRYHRAVEPLRLNDSPTTVHMTSPRQRNRAKSARCFAPRGTPIQTERSAGVNGRA
jgi:hypothetical protein